MSLSTDAVFIGYGALRHLRIPYYLLQSGEAFGDEDEDEDTLPMLSPALEILEIIGPYQPFDPQYPWCRQFSEFLNDLIGWRDLWSLLKTVIITIHGIG